MTSKLRILPMEESLDVKRHKTRLDMAMLIKKRTKASQTSKPRFSRIGTALSSAKFGKDSHTSHMLSFPPSNSWKFC
ncbi:hypothetical protein CY34DRAFT_804236 [Suillus luteus UH-Slu-Lm8-n1]|uniref:Unplaced genomic scaffold CY34scaffold_91, whole genome shotgun sequence n=1 Tax=Suillus luteus UH-Slu-Lm8-n1 TaxID=930992 RepID=A0A0C9ZZL9_9AGAM|nr:hypothetical protein CY34DRAFT_804236 [Suillus luteus UH-Slu-Lm8-n1]